MANLRGEPVAAMLNAGEQTCATLIMSVRQAITPLAPGEILAVVSYDPSARLDLPAWSRMTGHDYQGIDEHENHTIHYLRKRGTPDGEDPDIR
jgi:tRNA 2-thiouridine synthesizing protein A